MRVEPLDISGAYRITPVQHVDSRGRFLEWYRADLFQAVSGHRLDFAQANASVSRRGTVRGVHFARTPPGQAKYVTCVRGAVWDFIVDLRVGSPTFGQHRVVVLDDIDCRAVYLAEGLGHAICALEDDTTVLYLCSATYNPAGEGEVSPLDPDLGLDFPLARSELILSDKDAAAPTLAEAGRAGWLPDYAACRALYAELESRSV